MGSEGVGGVRARTHADRWRVDARGKTRIVAHGVTVDAYILLNAEGIVYVANCFVSIEASVAQLLSGKLW